MGALLADEPSPIVVRATWPVPRILAARAIPTAWRSWVATGEETDTIEDVYEPFLLQLGFLQRTPRGRVITKLGRIHVGAPAAPEPRLF